MIHHSPNLEQQIPFDPDFDEADHVEMIVSNDNSRFGLTSKQAFVVGLISSMLTLGTIGFIILLVMLFYS
ncbi:hypothetical protein A3H10_02700 [Candidatus Uhrbacteria bacterium RIFCSPLOWO2_12_FULL_46_10]|uniref:Uncharacterized protein n=1 Tax=Candidatus Uhrbacteria bacterium RIFCSPLOWO2_01_FULL_47_25 TaxID=1802402 RepID=A0A1F7UV63_9BACT|nr:MAG: hypothetical protein UX68_C0011G0014 [Parcubacteria group bacterium GW2011_GWA2_46_9]OGL59055.1 MAG: hypothetical protein A2752_02460 [Candidatus Uhrbacteria bacterium RIFCSPHIGHO2_01_FULL_46_23]OGL68722.1 MAG: hypothetical protein A3D60_02065 [Candidatus Uhrbacteria bacterium RIFCSPHIGHO2_02_FULL_47_29]OGL74748.1 MAG: hypothetical protein A3E96_03350 [Candidatus Uhrbacteria bacterium RIFCSPHIGHO2_12_FULL_46_13]OGL82159.1 MAG: hypothetical protein A2936_01180 [Candidatus Uhrbacteria bac